MYHNTLGANEEEEDNTLDRDKTDVVITHETKIKQILSYQTRKR